MLAFVSAVRYHIAMRLTTTCAACGRAFQVWPRTLRRVKNPTCSRQCNGKLRGAEWKKHAHKGPMARTRESYYRAAMRGPKNPAWKGGVTTFRKHGNYSGVKYCRAPEWARPMARADGYVMMHRLTMALMCNRLLTRTEVVHHRDHDPTNNAPSNLELWPDNRSHKAAEHGRVVAGVANRLSPPDSVVL